LQVVAAAKPQEWELKEIFSVACALGFTLIVENCSLLIVGLNAGPGATGGGSCGQDPQWYEAETANESKCTGFVADWLGDDTYGTITYRELKTLIYLSLSVSGFMTVLAARTRDAFFSRRMGYLLMSATVVAFIVTTTLALNVSNISSDLDMDNLKGKQVVFVWGFVVCGFLIQDLLVKRAVYFAYDWYYNRGEEIKNGLDYMHAIVSNQIEEERLTMRRTSVTAGGGTVFADGGAGPTSRPGSAYER